MSAEQTQAARGKMSGEWVECELADACSSVDYGLTASASDWEVGPRFLRITDIVTGHIDWSTVPYVAADEATAAKYQLQDGDIVIARTGASTGASAYVRNPPPAVFASYLVRLRVKPEFDARFIAYYLRSEHFRTFIRSVLGDKSAQPNASASTMIKAPLRVPKDKAEQRAIAHILGTLDDKIELNRRMSETLEQMARALFKAWFVDFEPVRAKMEGRWRRGQSLPGLPAHLYDLFPARLVDSELGEIPEGWRVENLSALADIQGGKQLPGHKCRPMGAFPVFGANGIMGYTECATHDAFVIAFGRVGAYCGSIYWTYRGAWINNNASAVVPKRWPEFILQAMLVTDFESMRTGSAQPFIPNSALAAIRLLRAPDAILDAFCAIVRPLRRYQAALQGESRTLASLRDALLPKVISGELRVRGEEYPFLCDRIWNNHEQDRRLTMNEEESQTEKMLDSAIDKIVEALELLRRDIRARLGSAAVEVAGAIISLDESCRRIALEGAAEKLGIQLAGQPTSQAAGSVLQGSPREEATTVPAPATKTPVDIRSFAQEKKPRTTIERVVLVAYYLSELAHPDERKPEIDKTDLVNYFKQAGFRLPPWPHQALVNARNAGYLDPAGRGKYRLNAVGHNLVAHNLPRESDSAAGGRRRKARKRRARKKNATAR